MTNIPTAHAIIVAAGRGERLGSTTPKQFLTLGRRRVIDWSIEAFARHPAIGRTVIVVSDPESVAIPDRKGLGVAIGGANRTQSVKAGLNALRANDNDIVLIHDAARPGLEAGIIDALIAALPGHAAAVPVLPVVDALKRRGETLTTIARDDLVRVQTPQAFRYGDISRALAGAEDLVDDLAAIEADGGDVALVPGDERLAKITLPGDLERMTAILAPSPITPRIGTGFDVHAFGPGGHVTLCGVEVPHSHGLVGHSDADVAWHALTDAILGAAALGDIGDHFPPSDPQWKGANSEIFLRHALSLVEARGLALATCDLTLICEAPKIRPHRAAMRERTAQVTGLAVSQVSLKATTTERLGFTGRGEGLAAQALAVLSPQS
ncbi:MAG: bifunctional 2-C-methyl-D-erythritol 4-phosphate cytidylyltransferase/2-C-methyl-D-erythritol 2,4-cyclodiphosphate synthase [Pseudomonadota bacterium]